jgi:ClpP class serine protease
VRASTGKTGNGGEALSDPRADPGGPSSPGPAPDRSRLAARDAYSLVEDELAARLSELEKVSDSDVLAYFGPIVDDTHDLVRVALDDLDNKSNKLSVVLETAGGYAESAERFQRLFRHNYQVVDFIVPGYAMSAGTVLVMSGDDIWMDYSSILGPIDPQVRRADGQAVPALGYIEKYRELMRKAARGGLNTAEMMFLVQKFDPADLAQYDHAQRLSIALLKEWLVQYKFKNWTTTLGRGRAVTAAMREARAEEIAKKLTDTRIWHSHGRGIPMNVLIDEGRLNLRINDFGASAGLNSAIREYYILLKDYMIRRGHQVIWHTRKGHHGR